MQAAVADAGTISRSKALDDSLARAHQLAVAQNHPTVALEHLLFAIQDDPDGQAILISSGVGRDRLAADVSAYLGRLSETAPPRSGGSPQPGPDLLRILQLAAMAARQSQRRTIDGAIVLAAIIGDGNSPAAGMLKAQGLTFDAVIKALTQTAPARQGELAAAPPRASLPAPTAEAIADPVETATHPAPVRVPRDAETSSAEDALATARARVKKSEPAAMTMKPARPAAARDREPVDSATVSVAGANVGAEARAKPAAPNARVETVASPLVTPLEMAPPEALPPEAGPMPTSPPASPLPQHPGQDLPAAMVAAALPPGLSTLRPANGAAALPPLQPHRGPARPPLPPPVSATPPAMPMAPAAAMMPPAPPPAVAQRSALPPGAPAHGISAYQPPTVAAPHVAQPHNTPTPGAPTTQGYAPAAAMATANRAAQQLAPVAHPPTFAPPHPAAAAALPPQAFGPSLALDIVSAAAGLPASMRLGVPVLVEIRVPRDQIDVPRRRGPHALGGGAETPIYRVVSVRLGTGGISGLAVEPRSPETIWIGMGRDYDAHEFIWQFVVTPTRAGRFAVTLAVSGRTVSPYGVSGDDTPQNETFAVVVKRATGGRTKRFLGALGLMAVGAGAALVVGGPAITFAKATLAQLLK